MLSLLLLLTAVFAFNGRTSSTPGPARSSVDANAAATSAHPVAEETVNEITERRRRNNLQYAPHNAGRNSGTKGEVDTTTLVILELERSYSRSSRNNNVASRLEFARQHRTFEGMSRGAVRKHTANPLVGHDELARDFRNAVIAYSKDERSDHMGKIEQSWKNIMRKRPSNLEKIDIICKPQGNSERSIAKQERYKKCNLHLCIGKGGNKSGVEIEPASAATQTETELRAMQEVTKCHLKLKQLEAQALFSRVLSTERDLEL